MTGNIRYVVVGRTPCGPQWSYVLKETDGDGRLDGVLEDVLESFVSHADYVYENVMKGLDEARGCLASLGEAIRKEIGHIEAMQKCRTFDAMAKDLAESHAAIAHAISNRCWIENSIHKIAKILEGENEEP